MKVTGTKSTGENRGTEIGSVRGEVQANVSDHFDTGRGETQAHDGWSSSKGNCAVPGRVSCMDPILDY